MSTKLDPEIKAAWIEWLRDPNNKQTTGVLRDTDGYCCLGGLTEVCIAKGLNVEWQKKAGRYVIGTDGFVLPKAVEDFLDGAVKLSGQFDNTHGYTVGIGEDATIAASLADLNDNGYTFEDIANIIEEEF